MAPPMPQEFPSTTIAVHDRRRGQTVKITVQNY
jgi:hypothetical protein